MPQYTFKKKEKLTSKISIEAIISEGKSVFSYPIKFVFTTINEEENTPAKILFSVPKRTFKRAVDRNLLKRRMREAYRLNKHNLHSHLNEQNKKLAIMTIYVGKEIENYAVIEKGFKKGIAKLVDKLSKQQL